MPIKRHVTLLLWGLGVALAGATAPADAALFQLVELYHADASSVSVNAINNRGQAVGISATDDGMTQALLWSGAGAQNLGTWNGASVTPTAINDAGDVVGFANAPADGTHAVVWKGSGWSDLGRGYAQAINAGGQIVGFGERALLWSGAATVVLGNGLAAGINDEGTVVGYRSNAVGVPTAVVWSHGVASALERNAAAYSINGAGDIVGESRTAAGTYQATLWTAQGKTLLGSIEPGQHSVAFDINDAGQVVGYGNGATLWTGHDQVDLSAVLANPPGGQFRLLLATGINNSGQIVATGVDANNYIRAYLLTPIPEPASLALVLGGLCLLTLSRMRRSRS